MSLDLTDDKSTLGQVMAWCRQATSHCLNQCWPKPHHKQTQCWHHMASLGPNELTHWGWDKMAAFSQTTLPDAFSWMKMLQFQLKFHWSFFLRVQLTKFQHWFRQWLGADQATSHYLSQWWLDYWRICVTRPQWVNPWQVELILEKTYFHFFDTDMAQEIEIIPCGREVHLYPVY